MATLNAAVGEALGEIADAIEAKISAGSALDKAAIDVIRDWVITTKAVRFEGNNYAEEWVVEAEKRGLLNLRKTPEALAQLNTPEAHELFTKSGVYSEAELESRYHLEIERYVKDLEIEIAALKEIATTMVLPAAIKHQTALATSASALKAIGIGGDLLGGQIADVEGVAGLIAALKTALIRLDAEVEAAASDDLNKKATALAYPVSDAILAVREACDKLEETVDDALWPLPKYREMLFLL